MCPVDGLVFNGLDLFNFYTIFITYIYIKYYSFNWWHYYKRRDEIKKQEREEKEDHSCVGLGPEHRISEFGVL